MVEGEAEADVKDLLGYTALYSAVKLDRLEAVKALFQYGDIDVDKV